MASRFSAEQLIIPTENLVVQNKKEVDGKTKSLKTATRKGGTGLGGRRALNDITNKSSHRHEASSQKKDEPKEEFNVAEEMFLHNHKKCIEAQKHATNYTFYMDMVLPGHGLTKKFECTLCKSFICKDYKRIIAKPKNVEGEISADIISTAHHQVSKKAKKDPDSPRCYPEPIGLPMAEFADWLASSTARPSPPCSPMHWDSPPSSLFAWESEAVEFTLKEEIDV